MKCPFCGGESNVIDCRTRKSGYKYRRRRCKECFRTFSTKEDYMKDYTKPRAYIKRRHNDGRGVFDS